MNPYISIQYSLLKTDTDVKAKSNFEEKPVQVTISCATIRDFFDQILVKFLQNLNSLDLIHI